MEEQIQYLLQVEDPEFEEDPEFAFVVSNIIRKKEVSRTLRFRVPVARYANIVERIVDLDPKKVMELEEKFRQDPAYIASEDSERNILQIAESISPVAKNIHGSAATRIAMRNEIRALINYRGPPTLFITINPSDIHNPIVSVLANRCSTVDDIMSALGQSSRQRLLVGTKRPAASAMFFDVMMDSFVKIILGYDKTGKSRGVYGVCDAYYGTVEVQGRGSLHCHMLVWLRGHLPPERLKEAILNDLQYRDKLIAWLDSVMQSNFLPTSIVPCDKLDGSPRARSHVSLGNASAEAICELVDGLSDPHPGCLVEPQILQLSPAEFWKEYSAFVNELLLRYNWHRHCATCWKYLRRGEPRSPENCRFGLDGTTIPETSVEEGTGRVVVSRAQPMMTSFTDLVLFLLKCNMDVKFIGSGNEAKALMYYITDYITKAPLPIHQGLAALAYAIQQTLSRLGSIQSNAPVDQLQSAITIAVNSMLGHTEFSKTQILHQLLGGKEFITNETFTNINWGDIRKYVQASWDSVDAAEEREGLDSPNNDPNTQSNFDSTATSVYITPNNGEIVVSNQRLDYIHRPDYYSSLGLYNYFSTTRKYGMQEDGDGRVLGKGQHRFNSKDHPQYQTHATSTRKQAVVPVLLGPNLARSTSTDAEKEKWAMDTLILYKPWRSPFDLKHASETWTAAMSRFEAEISARDQQRIANMSVLAEGREARSQYPRHTRIRRQFESDSELMMDLTDDNTPAAGMGNAHEQNVFYTGFAQPSATHQPGDSALATVVDSPERSDSKNDHAILDVDTITALDKCYHVHDSHLVKPAADDSLRTSPGLLALAQRQYDKLMGVDESEDGEDDSAENEGSDLESRTIPTSSTLQPRSSLGRMREPDVSISTLRDNVLVRSLEHQATNDGVDDSPVDPDPRVALVQSIAIEKGIAGNPEQLRAFEMVAEHVMNSGPQLLMYVGGMGGTGKSYVIKAIIELFDKLQRRHELAIGAPTGIAATLIGGSTLHSLILANPSQNTKRSDKLAEIWRPIKYMIVDEVSMVGAHFFALMSSRIRIGKADIPFASALPFGGVNIIFTGDFCQLTPPKQKSVFSYELVRSPSIAESRNPEGINNLAGAYLWRQVRTVVLLQKNHRQSVDPTFARVLELIRKGAAGGREGNSLRIGGMSILTYLRQRELQQVQHHSPETLESFKDAPVVVGSKRLRDLINVKLIRSNAARIGQEVHLYHSRDIVQRREVPNGWVRGYLWNLPSRRTRDTFGLLPLFVGMKVMVTENISITHRAVNGAEGTVTQICYTEGKDGIRYADVVYVHIPKSGVHLPGLEKDVIPIFPTPTRIQHTLTIGSSEIKSFTRRQCPLMPAYCYTDYKSQGRTLEKVVVDLTSARNQGVYVMLSRVTSLEGVLILRWFPGSKILQGLSEELRDELCRIEELNRATAVRYCQIDKEEREVG